VACGVVSCNVEQRPEIAHFYVDFSVLHTTHYTHFTGQQYKRVNQNVNSRNMPYVEVLAFFLSQEKELDFSN